MSIRVFQLTFSTSVQKPLFHPLGDLPLYSCIQKRAGWVSDYWAVPGIVLLFVLFFMTVEMTWATHHVLVS